MKVILLKDIPKVGQRNTIKEVKDGFALNMLIPRGLARQTTPDAVQQMERAQIREGEANTASAAELVAKISKLGQIEIKVKANEKGHLFAGVGKTEIAKELGVSEENIILEHPIKEVGEHEVEIKIGEESKKIKLLISTNSKP
jgi:large subunit ribosomal protein L9